MATDISILEFIQSRDPDGISETQPTDADYARFAAWVIVTFGRQALVDYETSDWMPPPEV